MRAAERALPRTWTKRGLGTCPCRPRRALAHLPHWPTDHHAARAPPSRAPGGPAAGVGGARHLARRPGPCLTMDNLPHAFTAITCTHAVSRERPSGLTLAAAVLAANAMHSLLAMPLLAIGAALGARFVAP